MRAREARDRGAPIHEQFKEIEILPSGESARLVAEGIRELPENWLDGRLIADAVERVWRVNSRSKDPVFRLDAIAAVDDLILDSEVACERKRIALLEVMVPLAMDNSIFVEYEPRPGNGYRFGWLGDRSLKARCVAPVRQVMECVRDRPVEVLRLGGELVKLKYSSPEMIAPLQGAAMEVINVFDRVLELDRQPGSCLFDFFRTYQAVVSEDLVEELLRLGMQGRLPRDALFSTMLIARSRPGRLRTLAVGILAAPGPIFDQDNYSYLVSRYAETVPDELLASLVAKITVDGFVDLIGTDGASITDVRRRLFPGTTDAEDLRSELERGAFRWSSDWNCFWWDARRDPARSDGDR